LLLFSCPLAPRYRKGDVRLSGGLAPTPDECLAANAIVSSPPRRTTPLARLHSLAGARCAAFSRVGRQAGDAGRLGDRFGLAIAW